MSYAIDLLKPLPGETVKGALERTFAESHEDEPLKERLAAALMRQNARLKRFDVDNKEMSRTGGRSEQDAPLHSRQVELSSSEDDGVQITIDDGTAWIVIPYWHEDDRAEEVLKQVLGYIRVFQDEAGYVAYDPQLGRVVGEDSDLPDMLMCYRVGV